ncbi:S1 RNA-binding domain-containing protein [Anaeromassilibacillus sp. SJQ-5]
MPKKNTENLDAAEELTVHPEILAAETEKMDEKTDAAQVPVSEIPEEAPAEAVEVPKPKRTRRRKAAAEEADSVPLTETPEAAPTEETVPAGEEPAVGPAVSKPNPTSSRPAPILTLEAGADVETEENLADIIWHEIHNAYRTRRMLTGTLGGLEQTDNGKTIAIVEYKGYRVIIPLKEMVMGYQNNLTGEEYTAMIVRQHKLLSRMLGAEIDFIVKGIDSKTRSVVASRKEAMLKKRKIFYMDTDAGEYRIYDGRIIQARVIATAEKAIRIEAFGVETSIMARDLSWDWIGDARDRFSVGDQVLVRILSVSREDIEHISIKADLRSVSDNRQDNLRLCRVQSKYAGTITDVHKGVVYIRLTNGVNAIAHSCYDRRRPGKKDNVSFVVTGIDEDRGVALGIITRIIRQNL